MANTDVDKERKREDTTKRDALIELRDKVKAGDIGAEDFYKFWGHSPYSNWFKGHKAWEAFNGSLDAAKALHEAVLPGWSAVIRTNGVVDVLHPQGMKLDQRLVWADTPARAWLLAILEALIAMEDHTNG